MSGRYLVLPPAPDHSERSERYIGLTSREQDYHVILLHAQGVLTDKAIARETGLSLGQIQNRVRKARPVLERLKMTRRHARNGTNPLARRMMEGAANETARAVLPGLRQIGTGPLRDSESKERKWAREEGFELRRRRAGRGQVIDV